MTVIKDLFENTFYLKKNNEKAVVVGFSTSNNGINKAQPATHKHLVSSVYDKNGDECKLISSYIYTNADNLLEEFTRLGSGTIERPEGNITWSFSSKKYGTGKALVSAATGDYRQLVGKAVVNWESVNPAIDLYTFNFEPL